MRKHAIAGTLSLLFAATLAAQEPPKPQDPQAPPRTPTTAAQEKTVTGCLYRENQIAGRTPNVAEKAGVLEDYILVDSSMGATPSTPGATGTSGAAAKLYKVEGPSDEKLKALVGKRVEVTGKVDAEAGAKPGQTTPDKGLGPDKINLSEIEASGIREVSGSCPATPAVK